MRVIYTFTAGEVKELIARYLQVNTDLIYVDPNDITVCDGLYEYTVEEDT